MQYRKKPVIIEARQLTPETREDIAHWIGGEAWYAGDEGLYINTLEGTMVASDGDFIIQGVQGEFYPCKPDIFAETYEPVIDPYFGMPTVGNP